MEIEDPNANIAQMLLEQMTYHQEQAKKYKAECHRLWKLLDDIDTAGDMFKPEINGYFHYVNDKATKRKGLFYSDGYNILEREDD